ncbi:hypothetical protein Rmf_38420 [Roseomonas fluvialis]|uniref:Uncharacterized protein n=1 Tax=Roseomonas fluvialis TaxID=1750527 RepID=A0ABN6P938_9PROT|nr:hypothetical protein Rmf_38420 [Roseomonas fluvialis]
MTAPARGAHQAIGNSTCQTAAPRRVSDYAQARSGSAKRDRAQPASRRQRTSAWREAKPADAGARRLRDKGKK